MLPIFYTSLSPRPKFLLLQDSRVWGLSQPGKPRCKRQWSNSGACPARVDTAVSFNPCHHAARVPGKHTEVPQRSGSLQGAPEPWNYWFPRAWEKSGRKNTPAANASPGASQQAVRPPITPIMLHPGQRCFSQEGGSSPRNLSSHRF